MRATKRDGGVRKGRPFRARALGRGSARRRRRSGTTWRSTSCRGTTIPGSSTRSWSHSDAVAVCDERVVQVDGSEMISLSYAKTRRPGMAHESSRRRSSWRTWRASPDGLSDCSTAIFNLHVPPHASGLDDAPRLDETLRPIHRRWARSRSFLSAVTRSARAMGEFQPLVSLHGHIHESRGVLQEDRWHRRDQPGAPVTLRAVSTARSSRSREGG